MAAMTALRYLACGLLLAGLCPGPLLPAPDGITPQALVQGWLDSWTRLAGRFSQEVSSPTLPGGQVESGTFEISRPDRMRWDYTSPERKLAVTDGRSTWLYLPEDRQVIVGSLASLRRDGAVALLLSGSLRLDEAFAVDEVVIQDGRLEMALVPRSPSASISRLDLVASEAGTILSFTVHDPAGNSVLWVFRDLRLDPPLPEDRFSFQVPPGVEVQDLEAMVAPSP
jgi:outer membrane lipoprotein carrier protein